MNEEVRNGGRRPSSVLQRRVPTTLEAIDAICGELRGGCFEIPEDELFTVELLLREALTNAVLHAPETNPSCEIWCEIERIRSGIAMRIRDTGTGFDWRRHLHSTPTAAAESGRGIHILRRHSSALRFSEQGNQVEVIRIFGQGGGNGKF
ncbi:MAG TPA: ATP-binding protein [Bryobacteraceae bacterium]|nr:ATP-binding protein [Bryobacteraceae bacterium]